MPAPDRRCTRCKDLNQSVPESIYPAHLPCCPKCGNAEFEPQFTDDCPNPDLEPPKMPLTTRKPKPAANPQPAAASAQSALTVAMEIDVPVDEIYVLRSLPNPRKNFDEQRIKSLAESIESVGLQQRIVVRRVAGGEVKGYQLIAGERRLLAHKLLQRKTIAVRLVVADDNLAREIQLIENGEREDLNPIEKAEALKVSIEQFGMTQEKAGRLMGGMTQGQVSNLLRMLKLPVLWRERVAQNIVPLTTVRDYVLPYVNVEPILLHLEEAIADVEPGEHPRWANLPKWVNEAVYDCTRRLEGSIVVDGVHRHYDVTALREELTADFDVREVTVDDFGDDAAELLAFKKEEFEQYLINYIRTQDVGKAEAKADAEEDTQEQDDEPADEAEKKPKTAAEVSEKSAKDLAVLHKKLYRYRVQWLQQRLAQQAHTMTDDQLLLFVLGLAITNGPGTNQRGERAKKLLGHKGDKFLGEGATWNLLGDCDRKKLRPALIGLFQQTMELKACSFGSDCNPIAIETMARENGIEMEKDWEIDRGFLEMHTAEQLQELAKEFKLEVTPAVLSKKSALVTALMTVRNKFPKSLKTLKACDLVD